MCLIALSRHSSIVQAFVLVRACVPAELRKNGLGVSKKCLGRVEFGDDSFVHCKDPVTVNDGVEPMRNGHDGSLTEVGAKDLLHHSVSVRIY